MEKLPLYINKIPRVPLTPSSSFFSKVGKQDSPEYETTTSSSNRKIVKKGHGQAYSTSDINNLRSELIGEDRVFEGPFGPRKCVYLDHTASGRSIHSIENFILENVLPVYANTHTTTSFCSSQITAYREESRKIIKKSCQGGLEDELIFCGAGATAAVHKLVHSVVKTGEPAPIVLIGPFEHHSSILPWREVAKQIINIPENEFGLLDMKYLERVLQKLKSKKKFQKGVVLGVFSAASNVTGALTDDVAVTVLMHKYGALAFWDYAAAAPHVKIDMNPKTGDKYLDEFAKKDALYFSGHKFTGGPQTTGILLAKKYIFRNPIPHNGGGGTVLFVTKKRHQYLPEITEREEGGTPDIIGSIRLGLVFQLKNDIGVSLIIKREGYFCEKVLNAWKQLPQIIILGYKDMPRIPIISIMIKHLASGYFLHHDFVVALLNDLFGIQCRGGCMCTGPYSQNLLGIDERLAKAYETILSEARKPVYSFQEKPTYDMIMKPGFIRISLPFHASEEEINFTIYAVEFVAKYGWRLLPFYRMHPESGTFRFAQNEMMNQVITKKIKSFQLQRDLPEIIQPQKRHPNFEECLEFAASLIRNANVMSMRKHSNEERDIFMPERLPYRWFLLPFEAAESWITKARPVQGPFVPKNNYKRHENIWWSLGSIPQQIRSILDTPFPQHALNQKSLKRGKLSISLDNFGLEEDEDNFDYFENGTGRSRISLSSGFYDWE